MPTTCAEQVFEAEFTGREFEMGEDRGVDIAIMAAAQNEVLMKNLEGFVA